MSEELTLHQERALKIKANLDTEAFIAWAFAKHKENKHIAERLGKSKDNKYEYYRNLADSFYRIPCMVAQYQKDLEMAKIIYNTEVVTYE